MNIHPNLPFELLHLIFSFAAVKIIMEAGGHRLTANVNLGHNKLLSVLSYMFALLMRTGLIQESGLVLQSGSANTS